MMLPTVLILSAYTAFHKTFWSPFSIKTILVNRGADFDFLHCKKGKRPLGISTKFNSLRIRLPHTHKLYRSHWITCVCINEGRNIKHWEWFCKWNTQCKQLKMSLGNFISSEHVIWFSILRWKQNEFGERELQGKKDYTQSYIKKHQFGAIILYTYIIIMHWNVKIVFIKSEFKSDYFLSFSFACLGFVTYKTHG